MSVHNLCKLQYPLYCCSPFESKSVFVGGGGGASAPDGSGLAYRYAIGLKGHLNPNFNLLARYSTYDFPTGSIACRQVQLGFSYGFKSILPPDAALTVLVKLMVNVFEVGTDRI